MKLFLRTILITWAVMSLLAVLAVAWPSVLTPTRERSVPLSAIEACATQAITAEGLARHAGTTPSALCSKGHLLSLNSNIETGRSGGSPTSAELRMIRLAEQGTNPVIATEPGKTLVAFRVGTASQARVYLAAVPAPEPTIFRHLELLSPLFIACFFSAFIAAFVVRPLAQLNAAAEVFGSGDLAVRIHSPLATRRDELGDLARTFNGMADRIESLVVGYKEFLAHASHELGSPLTRLNLALALAKRKAGPELENEHERIAQEAYRLNNLVHEMLLLARLESGNEVVRERTLFAVHPLIKEAYQNASFECENMQKTVSIKVLESFSVLGYPVLLQRAIDNVMRNAVRYARQHLSIEVTQSSSEGEIRGLIVIADDGPGVTRELQTEIFKPFLTLADTGGTGIGGGSGLGLAIAKQAIIANGGSIRASRSPQGGLLVTIELPIVPREVACSLLSL